MKMTFQVQVDAPRDEVFAAFADVGNLADRVEGIERVELLTDGPIGVGTRFRETRIMFKREATEEMKFTAFDAPNQFTLEADSCGARFTSVHRFTEQDGGTLVELDMSSKATTFAAKLFTPLGFLMAGSMKKLIRKDMDQMKAAIESRAAAPVA